MYVYGIGNGLISRDTPPNTWPQYVDMRVDHEGKKIYLKWWKWVDAIALFQLHDEDSWLFSTPCNATSPVLQFCE